MAFQAPTRARQLTLSRHQSYQEGHSSSAAADSSSAAAGGTAPLSTAATEEWVVFSPTTPGGAASTILTGGTNRESDVGSSITASSPRASDARYDARSGAFDEGIEEDEDEDDEEESLDGAETDSLQPFREDQGPVLLPTLPTHDGLGTFSSSGASGFRSLEESLRMVAAFGQEEEGNDTHSRIQKWRMEQGHVLMDEIEKATRRRRRLSLASRRSGQVDPEAKLNEAPNMVEGDEKPSGASSQPASEAATETEEDNESETFWKRITRSFIRDIIGIDDQLLEVLFGEALPAEAQLDFSDEEAQFKKDAEERILNRIAKELGELVHLYTQHPSGTGAFSTHPKRSDEQKDGAKTPQPRPSTSETAHPKPQTASSATSSVPQFQFVPTLALRPEEDEASHAALWGIEEEDDLKNAQLRHEYWEQELDVHLVFSYLKSRFSRTPKTTAPSSVTTHASTPPPLHHYHPLINRKPSYYISSRSPPKSPPAPAATKSMAAIFAPFIGGGSCATHDRVAKERRSSKTSSKSRGYYWDVATSVGSGQSSCVGTGVWAAI